MIIESLSQKPSGIGAGDVQRLFNRYRDNHAVRFALKCGNREVSDADPRRGRLRRRVRRQSRCRWARNSSGVGYLYGAADHTPTVRTYLADAEDTDEDLAAARVLRERAGTLTGFAAGEDTGTPARDVLADVLAVFGTDPALHWAVLADRLAAQFPDRWADATADAVSAQCRDLGVPSVPVKSGGQALRGLPPRRCPPRRRRAVMTAGSRYRVTAALPAADLRQHSSGVTAVTGSGPLACPVTGNATRPARDAEVPPWA